MHNEKFNTIYMWYTKEREDDITEYWESKKTKSLKAKLLKRILPFVIIGSIVISLQGLLISKESTINTNTKLVTQI